MRTRLPSDLHAPAAARRFVSTGLRDVLAADQQAVCDDVALIVSELVTNSVRAEARTIDLELDVDDERVEVSVTDDASGWPVVRVAGADSVRGRGLEIVGHLADSWHAVARHPGKSVIATRRRP
ncbi:anti-sigma regulatory factor (Ser/Thr protein kinase) [Marmoricola sp. URHA0025 HA25]